MGNGSRVFWLEHSGTPTDEWWDLHNIRTKADGNEEKYDNVQVVDIDGDGDLDVLTSEENRQLGALWFENPYTNYFPLASGSGSDECDLAQGLIDSLDYLPRSNRLSI